MIATSPTVGSALLGYSDPLLAAGGVAPPPDAGAYRPAGSRDHFVKLCAPGWPRPSKR